MKALSYLLRATIATMGLLLALVAALAFFKKGFGYAAVHPAVASFVSFYLFRQVANAAKASAAGGPEGEQARKKERTLLFSLAGTLIAFGLFCLWLSSSFGGAE